MRNENPVLNLATKAHAKKSLINMGVITSVSGWAGSAGQSSNRIPELKEQIEGVKQAAKERQSKAGPKEGKGKKKSGSPHVRQTGARSEDAIGETLGISGDTWKWVEKAANRKTNLPA